MGAERAENGAAVEAPSPLEAAAHDLQHSDSVRYWTDYAKVSPRGQQR